MRKGQSSITALAVAAARALSSSAKGALIDPNDAIARRLLPRPVAALIDVASRPALARITPLAMRANFGLVDHVALRTAAIDRELAAAVDEGIDQIAIVGAGLDSRAHRLQFLGGAAVYELDHPASQAEKRERAAGLPRVARSLHYAELDLERDRIADALAAAGFHRERPACFVLEGLLMYLPRAVAERTVEEIGAASAPGSLLLCTYLTPDLWWLRRARPFVDVVMRVVGEPLRTALDPEAMRALLDRAGFTLEDDTDTYEWAGQLAPDAGRSPLLAYERLARARKRCSTALPGPRR